MERPGQIAWWPAVFATVATLVARPRIVYQHVVEPVGHARVLQFLASVRLPLWGLTLAAALASWVWLGADPHVHDRALEPLVGGALAEALSLWLLLLVPLALPVIYFFGGLVSHLCLTLTGGAHRSVGASMRAYGLTLALVYVCIGLLDIPLYLGLIGPELYARCVGPVFLAQYVMLALALAWTHRVSMLRSFLITPVPVLLTQLIIWVRVLSVLTHFPGAPPPEPVEYMLSEM